MEESALTDNPLINFCRGSYMYINSSGPTAMHEPFYSGDLSCKNTFGVKRVRPSKVESYLKVNA